MSCIFYQEEVPTITKRGKCVASALKNAFSKCHSSLSSSPPQPQGPATYFDQEDEILVSAVMRKYMEWKSKRNIGVNSFCNLLAVSMEMEMEISINGDEFVSVSGGSHTHISSEDTAFVSANTCFSRSSSSSSSFSSIINIDFKDQFTADMIRKRSIIMEFIHCEGWPFGLCRNALLLPPLPKSPANSWSWKKKYK